MDVQRLEWDDLGPPEIEVQIQGCVVKKVPVDGGSSVNLMTQQTASNLGFTTLSMTPKILRMADQSRVVPVGSLEKVTTLIAGVPFELDYIIISPEVPFSFPILLGRPWLHQAQVHVNWKAQKLTFGKPRTVVSWAREDHQVETVIEDGYT